MNRGLAAAGLGALLILACKSPQGLPREAPEMVAARGLGRHHDYQEGFLQGTQMVRNALKENLRPFHPDGHAALPTLVVREGQSRPVALPQVEVHPRTGLPVKRIGELGAFDEGRQAGFEWALQHWAPGRWQARSLPETPSELPPLAELDQPGVKVWQQGDSLLWAIGEKGFPARCRWRSLPLTSVEGALMKEGVLWVGSREGLLALDAEEGWILAVQPPLPSPMSKAKKDGAEQEAFRRRLEAGDPQALYEEGQRLGPKGLPLLWRAAELGNGDALLELGISHLHGTHGLPKDEAKAWELIRCAQEKGSAEAKELLEAHGRGEL